MIEIVLVPTGIARFRAMLGDRGLCVSRQPFYDAARILQANGVEPTVEYVARYQGSNIVAMRSTVGEAARWTVKERDKGGLHRTLWRPFPGISETAEEDQEAI